MSTQLKQAMSETTRTLDNLNFDNSYIRLPAYFYQRVDPSPLEATHLISVNPEVSKLLDLDPTKLDAESLAKFFGGHAMLPGAESIAMKYTGHQFGVYNPDLGDGRGLLLGEVVNQAGERWDLHLKGAGRTAYSRSGDGRAVLRSSIREYLAGEAMQGLGIPTTRGLCLVGSEEQVFREQIESCAALLRVSRCHIRFGHFEHFFYRGRPDDLKRLADYCIDRYFESAKAAENPYLAMYQEIVSRTARLVALWQSYGFVHGVLNTDNMSILGETFDYGPYTFMDVYQPAHISNHTDQQGRYAFDQQPGIVHWNLSCLAQALLPLIPRESLETELEGFPAQYQSHYLQRMRARLGLLSEEADDQQLIDDLCRLLTHQKVDMTRFFRTLCDFSDSDAMLVAVQPLVSDRQMLKAWMVRYEQRLQQEAASLPIRQMQMRAVNPKYVLRNYMAEEAIREAQAGNYKPVNDLLSLLRAPFEEQPAYQRFAEEVPDWAGWISLSCSS
ncbi:MAG: YdiU family protein [Sedimenticola sp.]|nr:YdiU family protein [Sedimenticola sp.]